MLNKTANRSTDIDIGSGNELRHRRGQESYCVRYIVRLSDAERQLPVFQEFLYSLFPIKTIVTLELISQAARP